MTAISPTKFGRFPAPEPPNALLRYHFHDGTTTLREVDHEPKVAVLDQEDLLAQGIRCSQFISGATDVDALGSCTANTATEALSNVLSQEAFTRFVTGVESLPGIYDNTVLCEKAAITFYHGETWLTGQSSEEWPPTDCGSSGPYIEKYAQQLGLISTARLASGAENIVSLMQSDGLLWGTPWFNAWMDPGSDGFIDGNGSVSALQSQIASGVAGGHEIYLSAIVKLAFLRTGAVDAANTVLRVRNHWTKSWCDNGSALVHLSTIVALGGNCDLRQFVA